MTDQQHPATPPEELKQELWKTFHKESIIDVRKAWENSVVKTYHAGADAELEACCKALEDIWDRSYHDWTIADLLHELRTARRPKPPSLAEQALVQLSGIRTAFKAAYGGDLIDNTISAALKRLQELEQGNG